MYVLCTVYQLTDEERVYLNAAALGDVPIVRQSVDDEESKLNINCVDYMGRSALHLAVDSENQEAIELLLDRVSFQSIEEALLHAISKVPVCVCVCYIVLCGLSVGVCIESNNRTATRVDMLLQTTDRHIN